MYHRQPGGCLCCGHDRSHREEGAVQCAACAVWGALTDAEEFGQWFGVKLDGPFKPSTTRARAIVPTTVDAEVASASSRTRACAFDIMVERIEPERLFSFRWHPSVEPEATSSQEPTTLVVFTLDDAPEASC